MDRPTEPPGGDARPTLQRPPGERYGAPAAGQPPDPAAPPRPPTTQRAIARATLVALLGTIVLVVLGGVFSMSAGLLVVAAIIGWAVGRTVRADAAPPTTATTRAAIAVALALGAIILGQIGMWLVARVQGGSLGVLDYIVQARGALVIAEIGLATVVAWWTAR